MTVNKVGKSVESNVQSFLTRKPLWVFWIVYSAISGILFGIFYTAMFLMAQQWWIPVVIIIAVGMLWGAFAYTKDSYVTREKTTVTTE